MLTVVNNLFLLNTLACALSSFQKCVHANMFYIIFSLFVGLAMWKIVLKTCPLNASHLCISSHLCREPYGTVFDPGFHLTFKSDRKLLLVDLRI